MPYATVAEFRTKYFDVPTDIMQNIDGSRTATDDSAIIAALEDASSEIDSILGVRYIIPIAPISLYLINACRVIARKNLHYFSSEENPNDSVRLAYLDVIDRLTEIKNGDSVLPPNALGISPPFLADNTNVSRRKLTISQPIHQRAQPPDINFRGTLPRRRVYDQR